jgi:hypothetical protein
MSEKQTAEELLDGWNWEEAVAPEEDNAEETPFPEPDDPGPETPDNPDPDEVEEQTDAPPEVEEPEEDEEDNPFLRTAKTLADQGLFDISEDDEIDDVYLVEKWDNSVREATESMFMQLRDSLDPHDYRVVKHILDGGSYSDFNTVTPSTSFDVESEQGQKAFLKYYYQEVKGNTAREADRLIKAIDEDELSEEATQAYKQYRRVEQAEVDRIAREKEQQALKQAEDQRKRTQTLLDKLEDIEEYKDISFSSRDRRKLNQYFTRKSVREGRNYITPFVRDMMNLARGTDPEKTLAVAKLLMSDFDLGDLKQKGGNEKVKEVEKKLQRKTPNPKNASNKEPNRAIWESF